MIRTAEAGWGTILRSRDFYVRTIQDKYIECIKVGNTVAKFLTHNASRRIGIGRRLEAHLVLNHPCDNKEARPLEFYVSLVHEWPRRQKSSFSAIAASISLTSIVS